MTVFEQRARRYVAWIKRRALAIIVVHIVLAAGGLYLIANHLPLFADFSYLLPQDAPSVRDLRKLESRVRANAMVQVIVRAPSANERAAAVNELVVGFQTIHSDLVQSVEAGDTELRQFIEERRHLFVPLADLERAKQALQQQIQQAKLAANPLFIDLDDKDPAQQAADQRQLEELRAKRKEAEAKLDRLRKVSPDGLIAMIQVRTPFAATDAGRGERLIEQLAAIKAKVTAAHPSVEIGFTAGVITAVAEHSAIFRGMVLSSVITTLLVALVLVLYFRSATLLALLLGTLGLSTIVSFGLAAITVGHLNAATAFLGAIIAGNGVNYGILLIARFLEERKQLDVEHALAEAILGTLRPTAVASLGASIAYGSLAATSFKGFADFAVIGALGMLVCWVASYLLLPALVLVFGRRTRIFHGDPIVGSTLVKLLGFRNSRAVVGVGLAVAAVACVLIARYVANDPFEYDIKNLRSEGDDAVRDRAWLALSDRTFGRGYSGRTYIAADRPEQVPMIVSALRARDAGVPPEHQTIGEIESILDVVPEDQDKKLAVLAEIRTILDDDALAALDDKTRAELMQLRPPDNLEAFTKDDLPTRIKDKLTEKNGRIGLVVSIRPADHLDEWDGRDLIRFANAVRKLQLADGETITTSGSSVIFADIVESIERDGPMVTLIAMMGLTIMVVLLVGWNRRAAAVLLGTVAGSLLMVAFCAAIDLKVNFLDFVALPITLGLGIDYAINIAHRHDHEETPDPILTLRTSGSAVFVCSLTTIIGYGSLLASENLAIRGFGTASLIGEVACVFSALVLVPAILALGRRRLPPQARIHRES
ncbi:MAG: RND family transporter [Kofleriaceae bacterium]